MTSLGTFNVAHNNLSSTMPDSKKKKKKSNLELLMKVVMKGILSCGPPLHNNCIKMHADHEIEEGGSFMDMGSFYISFVVAYIVMLLGIVAILYINPYWRRAWFNLI